MQDIITEAIIHFRRTDPVMAELVTSYSKGVRDFIFPMKAKTDEYFASLCRSIVSQQLSTKAAATIWSRFVQLSGDISPLTISKLSIEELRSVGLSGQKVGYIKSIASSLMEGSVDIVNIDNLSDADAIRLLTSLHGVGVWTAEMFLIFTLGRKDVFSFGDLGLKNSLTELYEVSDRPAMEGIVARWEPYRSVASLALWHRLDNKPS